MRNHTFVHIYSHWTSCSAAAVDANAAAVDASAAVPPAARRSRPWATYHIYPSIHFTKINPVMLLQR